LSSFSEFHLDPVLQRGIADLGFTTPTPIQIAALPPGLAGRDVLACAMTGSGKTAAFVCHPAAPPPARARGPAPWW
jgi:ATP-dependent RNA helicase RhlE